MKAFVQDLLFMVKEQVVPDCPNLLEIAGVEDPNVYWKLYKELRKKYGNALCARLSEEKYCQFVSVENEAWNEALYRLNQEHLVLNNETLTKWRNQAANDQGATFKVYLLMGVEAVQDKGGLEGFTCVTTHALSQKLAEDYSRWYIPIFEEYGFDAAYLKKIDTLYRRIFNHVPINAMQLSRFIDTLREASFTGARDLIMYILATLPEFWDLPPICSESVLNSTGKASEFKLIDNAYDFINAKESFMKGLKIPKVEEQLEKYAVDNMLAETDPFPADAAIFSSYSEFKRVLVEFIIGKNYQENRALLVKLDFIILADILNIKIDNPKPKQTRKTIHGDPLTVYSEMILKAVKDHTGLVEEITITVKDIRLSQCSDSEDKKSDDAGRSIREAYNEVSMMLGGIVDFLNNAGLGSEEQLLQIKYAEGVDPFTMDAYDSQFYMRTKTTRNWDDMCRIDFEVKADDAAKVEYRWGFSPKAPWKKTFTLLRNQNEDNIIPSLATCEDMDACISCEDDDEFCAHLESSSPKILTSEHRNQINALLAEYGFLQQFDMMCEAFDEWESDISRYGFFNAWNSAMNLIGRYNDLIEKAKDSIKGLPYNAKEALYLITDSFMIVDNANILKDSKISAAIIPAYHPLTIEKMQAQAGFFRNGLREIFPTLDNGGAVRAQIDKLWSMATVSNSVDAVISGNSQFLSCQCMHGYHALYLGTKGLKRLLSATGGTDNIIIDDDSNGDEEAVPANAEIIKKNVDDYLTTYPSKYDGLKITLIDPPDMHHIVAAIQKLEEKKQEINITLNILSVDAQRNTAGYLRRWLDKYFVEDRKVHVTTYLRYVRSNGQHIDKLDSMLQGTDICFVYDVMKAREIAFLDNAGSVNRPCTSEVQFPMASMPEVISKTSGSSRRISTSQFQFLSSKNYTQLIHVMGCPNDHEGEYRAVSEMEMAPLKKSVLEEAHHMARWVICVDRAIDKKLLKSEDNKVIGFSTGEGAWGDTNVTVSANNTVLEDIKHLMELKFFDRFPSWSSKQRQLAATHCVDYASKLDGMRILQALNPKDYAIHSYLAYILTLQELKLGESDERHALRVLVNLDAYMHWFKKGSLGISSDTSSRPDLLLLEIPMEAGQDDGAPLRIQAKVIECKMGNESDQVLQQAGQQVCHGCDVLANYWNPDSDSVTRRYWYNQLYRVLAFSPLDLQDNQTEYRVIEQKLRAIPEGCFTIDWTRDIFTYWLDLEDEAPVRYEVEIDGNPVNINRFGQLYIQKMLMPEDAREDEFSYDKPKTREEIEAEIADAEEDSADTAIEEEEFVTGESDVNDEATDSVVVTEEEPDRQNEVNGRDEKKPTPEESSMDKPEDSYENSDSHADEIGEAQVTAEKKPLSEVRMLLGKDLMSKTPYYWEFGHPGLNNRHLLINGNSGCGKTYAIQTLLMEQALQGVSSIIFDYTAGFMSSKLDPEFKKALGDKIKQRIVRQVKVPVNPFAKHEIKIDEGFFLPEEDTDVATRIANIFQKVFAFGDQQKAAIYSAVMSCLKKYGDKMSFVQMAEEMEEQGGSAAERVLSKIQAFIDLNPFTLEEPFDWDDIRDSDGMVYIIQLTGYSDDIKHLLTEILLWDIWSFCEKTGDESKPMTIVLDEAQNLDHSATSPSAKILTEGRKFGLSGWYATQFMKPQLSDDEIQRLQQAGQCLYFCPPDEGVMTVAKNIDITSAGSKAWAERLKKLKKGECVTCGGMVRNGKWMKYDPKIIKITSFQERLSNEY